MSKPVTQKRIFASSVVGLTIVFITVFSMVFSPLAKAATWDGRGNLYGYFNNQFGHSASPYPSTKGPVLPNNNYSIDSIPASVNSTAALYEFLYDKYTHTGPYGATNPDYVGVPRAQQWDRTGSAFLVNSMLGRNGNQASRTISNADWSTLQQRLAAMTFNYSPNVSTSSFGCINTFYQYGNDDVSYYGDCGENRPAIVLTYGGSIVYVLYYICANPIGNFPGLPAVEYTLNPSISVNPHTSDGATSVNLTASVSKGGASAVNGAQWESDTFTLAPGVPVPGGGPSGLAPAAFYKNGAKPLTTGTSSGAANFTASVTPIALSPQQIDSYPVGTRICYTLSVYPYQRNNAIWNHSAPDCVTISKSPKVQVLGSDLIVGRGVASPGSKVSTSTTIHRTGSATGTFDPNMVTGFYGTGTDGAGNAQNVDNRAVADQHWRISSIDPGTAGINPCQGNPGSAFLVAATTYQGQSSPRNPAGNPDPAWKLDPSSIKGAWIGANPLASTGYYKQQNPSASCTYPANFTINGFTSYTYNGKTYNTVDSAIQALAPVWTFQMNDFQVTSTASCKIDPNSLQLNLKMSADDEAEIYINGVLVASKMDNANRDVKGDTSGLKSAGKWPASLVSVTTRKVVGAFREGANTITIKVKSASTATGLIVGGGTTATGTCAPPDDTQYGSWAEYGIIPSGTVTGMASAAGLAGGISPTTLCSFSLLTFANNQNGSSCAAGTVGNYSLLTPQPQIATQFPVTATTQRLNGTVNVDALPGGQTYTTNVNGAITLTSTTPMPAHKWIVINAPTATVTISKNLTYTTANLTSVADIPQLVIIAKTILIADTVTQVDSWLVATGTAAGQGINTCSSVVPGSPTSATVNASKCNAQLTVNGPIMTTHLYMYRTGPVNGGTGAPAEIFNLRPDAYLWALNDASGSGRLPTVSTTELPPRY